MGAMVAIMFLLQRKRKRMRKGKVLVAERKREQGCLLSIQVEQLSVADLLAGLVSQIWW